MVKCSSRWRLHSSCFLLYLKSHQLDSHTPWKYKFTTGQMVAKIRNSDYMHSTTEKLHLGKIFFQALFLLRICTVFKRALLYSWTWNECLHCDFDRKVKCWTHFWDDCTFLFKNLPIIFMFMFIYLFSLYFNTKAFESKNRVKQYRNLADSSTTPN